MYHKEVKEVIVPAKGHQQDRYQGQIDPNTKKRHGFGTYTFDAKFFVYEGEYNQGVKYGKGRLKMADGTVINGTFYNNQLIGAAEIKYPDGSSYVGYLYLGEKSGKGILITPYYRYEGQWAHNRKNGEGVYRNITLNYTLEGEWKDGQPNGLCKERKWNYSFDGEFKNGKKNGNGVEINDWQKLKADQSIPNYGRYEYKGSFKDGLFDRQGIYQSKESTYVYNGEFKAGLPFVLPKYYRILISNNTTSAEGIIEGYKNVLSPTAPLYYELETSINIYIDFVYQGPYVLDDIQPSAYEIEAMVKNWQSENKKVKNPPPMPDFTQPRMKKPELYKVIEESGHKIIFTLIAEGKQQPMKLDYRKEIQQKRKANYYQKAETLRKAEYYLTKKGGKKDPKGEPELKINLYTDKPSLHEQLLHLASHNGQAELRQFELPDDFPPGKYALIISSGFEDFGKMKDLSKDLIVKAKQPVKKK